MQFRLEMTDLLYHWIDPYPELALHRRADMISSKVQRNASKTVREDWSCTDNRLKVRDKIRKMTSERNGQKVLDETGTDLKLEKLVRKEVKRYLRGSRGVKIAKSTLNINKLQLLHLRLGHVSKDVILKVLKSRAAKGLGTTYEE
jgi:hypothetical protein